MNFRFLFLCVSLLICIALAIVVNAFYGIDTVYTHLFYLPIILTGIWYPRYALFLAAALGLIHIASDYRAVETIKVAPIIRAIMFLVVAAVTAYLVLRRDRLLGELQKINLELTHMSSELQNKNTVLQNAMDEIKTLKGILPICSYCKKIRDDKGYWNRLESYLHAHSEVEFSHGICPDCAKKLYPDYFNEE
ncbi:MAG TPA: hypothetical protein PKV86_09605 [Syntrophobacteraceae bacterium]|nr:hypothetical protein [Syntrophobacteraceae bacterium]